MNKDLGFTSSVYGFGAGVFFIAYFLLEAPFANVAGFVGPFIMGWIKDATGSLDGGLPVIACVCLGAAIGILCTLYDTIPEQSPYVKAWGGVRVPAPGPASSH